MREVGDVTFYEGTVPVLPDHGSTAEVQHDGVQVVHQPQTTPGPMTPASTPAPHDTEDATEDNDEENGAPAATPPVPNHYHLRAPKPSLLQR